MQLRQLLTLRRLALAAGLILAVAAMLWLVRTTGVALNPTVIRTTLAALGPWGPITLIGALAAILVVPVVPATVLQIGAGLAFGPALGLVYVLAGDVLGASVGFGLARCWGRKTIYQRLGTKTSATLDRLIGRISWRTVMLLRILPGPAYPLVSFAAGLSQIGFWRYLVASFLGVLPALALLVLAGDLVTTSPLLAFGLVVLLVGSLAIVGRLLEAGGSDGS